MVVNYISLYQLRTFRVGFEQVLRHFDIDITLKVSLITLGLK